MNDLNIRPEFNSSFVLLLVRLGRRKAYLTLEECNQYIEWWLKNKDRYLEWMASKFPQNNCPTKIRRLGLGRPEFHALYNDCLKMKAANHKYEGQVTPDSGEVVALYQ